MSDVKELGHWVYYFDGSGGEFYANCTKAELEAWLDTEESADGSPAPFRTAIPEGDTLRIYEEGSDYPDEEITLDDVNVDASEDEKIKDWDQFMEGFEG